MSEPLQKLNENWNPKTEVGRKVKEGEIKDIDTILNQGKKILEAEIVDMLLPHLEFEIILIGQSKGKFGGGKRSIWGQTQKKTKEGNKPKFSSMIVMGDKNGYVGVGLGKAKDTLPARKKALRNSRLAVIRVKRGCGSWECSCREPHSIPFKVTGRCGSSIVELIPAPRGTGLCVEKEIKKILYLAGIKDVYSRSKNTKTKRNEVYACVDALKKLTQTKVKAAFAETAGIIDGRKK